MEKVYSLNLRSGNTFLNGGLYRKYICLWRDKSCLHPLPTKCRQDMSKASKKKFYLSHFFLNRSLSRTLFFGSLKRKMLHGNNENPLFQLNLGIVFQKSGIITAGSLWTIF